MYGLFHANIKVRDAEYFPFNADITNSIQNDNAIAVTDALVKGDDMGGAWIISDIDHRFEISNELYHKQ